ncbi:nucleoside hydrolase [Caldicoprobacter algeriensis]|uniref:nucleoside hydrolase n=1 Tax=Caldicoprobacter algeriensis TaxID=699281 RepID=UPI002079D63F|nr:nucleoside hydrolase [Caldicoprobacter algeriensis]MCM8901769.1 nucleoside hydrolase [Caldicoprobacter algeriensis]
MPVKLLLDTDIGSDIDDAVCLSYLLANPECQLLGITTVSGEAEKRAMMASVLCNIAGKDVPIYPGAEEPLIGHQRQPVAQQARVLGNWRHKTKFPKGEAVEFLRRTIRDNPGEVVLLSIGPLTNIALLFKVDQEIPKLLRGLVMMCGVFTNRLPGVGPLEWNAICDPYATAIVYNTEVMLHRSVGLDVTCQVTMKYNEIMRRFTSPLLEPVLDFASVWFEKADQITFHDPLAAATIFDDKICVFQRGKVEVELASDRLKGMTHWSLDVDHGNHEVAVDVDRDRFFEHYFSVFT